MKLYWKHILWNHTVRLWYLWKYRNDLWKDFYCIKLVQTGKEMKACNTRIKKLLLELTEDGKTPN